jgi:tRNA-uridine 2-sulfurtransferase
LHHGCYGPGEAEDIEDARRVAEKLGIPYRVIDLAQEYRQVVLDYFNTEYLAGRTPNPCVRCNFKIKFGTLIEKAALAGLDFDLIASGHYARVRFDEVSQRYLLLKGLDSSKDQSYFLSALSQSQLQKLVLPLGELTKVEVRKIAAELDLPVAAKPDSQNFICGSYSSVITAEARPGHIINKQGKVLGSHTGIQNFTIGQRKGLGISSAEPLYVTAIDAGRNDIVIGERNDLFSREFRVARLNWLAGSDIPVSLTAKVKIRSSHREAEAEINLIDSGSVQVRFKDPQFAITPGQTAVFYKEDEVLGGGTIEQTP